MWKENKQTNRQTNKPTDRPTKQTTKLFFLFLDLFSFPILIELAHRMHSIESVRQKILDQIPNIGLHCGQRHQIKVVELLQKKKNNTHPVTHVIVNFAKCVWLWPHTNQFRWLTSQPRPAWYFTQMITFDRNQWRFQRLRSTTCHTYHCCRPLILAFSSGYILT